MEVLRDLAACPRAAQGTVVTIGFYDGVHLGHRLVIGEVRRLAAERGSRTTVVTFDPHPAKVVRPDSAPRLLTDLEQRLELLAATEVDYTLVLTFDEARSKEPAEDFVREVLVDCLQARGVVVGEDFHFGHRRGGNVALLHKMGKEHGFEVDGIKLIASGVEGARPVSSTAIREALARGDLESANRMLGRAHEVRGTVVSDDEWDVETGFSTAKIAVPDDLCLPDAGIYGGWCVLPGERTQAAAIRVVGGTPDNDGDTWLGVHLLDFAGDLDGMKVKTRFVAKLHDEPSASGDVLDMARSVLGV